MKPSLLFVGSFLSSKGLNLSVGEDLAEQLHQAGHTVFMTSHRSARPVRLLDMLHTAWVRRREYQAAYVEVYSGPAFFWSEAVCSLLQLLKKPYVLTLHGGNLPTFALRWPGRVKRLLKSARMVTAPSSYLVERLKPYHGKVRLLPNPVQIDAYPFRLRSEPGPRLVWLRAFHNIYQPQMVPHVVEKLLETFQTTTLQMIGPDKGDGSLQGTRSIIGTLGLQDHIEIIPGIPKSRVPEFLGRADIFINSTTVDNTPVSLVEAMACGLCIVSTNVGGIPYLVENETDALLVPPDRPEAMALAVQRILTEPGLAEKLSGCARKKAENFDWSKILPQWETLFQEMIAA